MRTLIAAPPEQWRWPRWPRFQPAEWCFPKRPAIQPAPQTNFSSDSRPAAFGTKGQRYFTGFACYPLQSIFQHHLLFGLGQDDARAVARGHGLLQGLQAARFPGSEARRDCSDAWRAMRCQRSTRFCAALARWASVRCATTGMIRLAPSSTHFSMAHSMRSNLKMERTRVRLGLRDTNNFAKFKLDPIVRDAGDTAAADKVTGRDIKFLPDSSAKDLREMPGVRTD